MCGGRVQAWQEGKVRQGGSGAGGHTAALPPCALGCNGTGSLVPSELPWAVRNAGWGASHTATEVSSAPTYLWRSRPQTARAWGRPAAGGQNTEAPPVSIGGMGVAGQRQASRHSCILRPPCCANCVLRHPALTSISPAVTRFFCPPLMPRSMALPTCRAGRSGGARGSAILWNASSQWRAPLLRGSRDTGSKASAPHVSAADRLPNV